MDLSKQFPIGKPIDVYVTHVDVDSGNYFVQINNEEAGKLDELMEEIDQYVCNSQSPGLTSSDIIIGDVYLAQYSVDAKWYRARVMAVKPGCLCEVHFIDYGNTEQIPLKFARAPLPAFLTLPPQAFECELDGMSKFRGPNMPTAISTLKESILEQELVSITTATNKNVLIVNLFKDASCSSSILDNLFSKVQRTPQNFPTIVDDAGMTSSKYQTLSLKQGTYVDFHVSHVEDPSSFSCQLLQEIPKILELLDELADEYHDADIPLMSSSPGYPCCAKFYEDDCWYRAVITNSNAVASGSIDVKFVDYGNSQTTSLADVKGLKEKHLDIPEQAVECTLYGVRPSGGGEEWSQLAKELFSKLTNDKHIIAEVFGKDPDGKYQVQLIDMTGAMDIQLDKILIAAKYAEKDGNTTLMNPPISLHYENKPESTSSIVSFPFTREALTPGTEEKVLVSSIVSPSMFYCMLYRTSSKLEKLMGDITRHYGRLGMDDQSLSSPSLGDPCCAKFTDDNSWYRAIVTDILSSGKVKVQFVDYGNSDTVKPKDVKKLSPQFSELPCQAIACSLYRVCPNGENWKTTDIKKFEDLALEYTGQMTVISKDHSELHNVELTITTKANSVNIAESLLLGGNARLVEGACSQTENLTSVTSKKFPKLTMTLGTYEDIVVSFADDPANLWCQLLKYKGDLDAIMNGIEEHCLSSSAPITSPSLGLSCCAQYSDEAWYRATITGLKKNNQVEVHFVDYGNYDIVSTSKLRHIKPEFMNLPVQAFKCRLEQVDIKNVTSFSPEVIDKFSEITADKELVGMIASYDETQEQYLISFTDTSGGDAFDIYEQIAPLMPHSSIKECVVPKQDLKPGRQEHVCVTTVTGLGNIYCQLMHSASQLDSLMVSIDDHYNNLAAGQEELTRCKAGDYCVAKYSEDGSWYRARIQETKSHSQVSVFYIDFGNGEDLPITSVKRLLPTFVKLPEQVISCSLSGNTSGFSDSQFVGLTLDQEFDMEIVSCQEGEPVKVMLYSRDTKKPITEVLTTKKPQSSPTIKQSSLEVGCTEKVYVTFSSGISKFSIQNSKSEDALAILMDQIHEHYSSLGPTQDAVEGPCLGSFCVALFGEDGAWYRAQITAVHSDTVEVFYVDYGNSEVLPLSNVKVLKPAFASLPCQALHCKLADVIQISDQDSAKFQQIVEDPELAFEVQVVTVGPHGVYDVRLFNKNTGECINQMFAGQIPCQKNGDFESAKLNVISLKIGESYGGQCPVASSPSKFWFHLNDNVEDLNNLLDALAEYYTSIDPNSNILPSASVGSYCCCLYSGDQGWYRAKVISLQGDQAEVCFVDFGNTEQVAVQDLKVLKEEFQSLPQQAIQCSLNGARPTSDSDWSKQAIDAFTDHVLEKDAVIRVVERLPNDSFVVDVLDETGSRDLVLQPLVKGGLIKDSPANQDYHPFAESFNKGDYIDVNPVWCQSPHDFYCQVLSENAIVSFNQMTSQIQSVYTSMLSSDNQVTTPTVGMPCCALDPVDNTWNRGRIVDVTNQTTLRIRFIDFGNEVTVELNHVKTLLPEFLSTPVQCVQCCLSSIKPAAGNQWSQAAVERFSDLVENKHLVAQVIGTGEGGKLAVELFDTEDESIDINIAQVFTTEHLAISSATPHQSQASLPKLSALRKLDLSSGDTVYITAVDSPHVMYCQKGGTEGRLDNLMTAIKDFYEAQQASESSVKAISPNDLCVALFSEDNVWYRAVAEEVLGDEIVVRFIDYGNTDSLHLDSIKPIDGQFLAEQMLAFECTLSGVRSLSDDGEWGTEVADFMANLGGDEGYVVTVVNSSGNDLEVSLSNSEGDLAQRLINEGLAKANKPETGLKASPGPGSEPSSLKNYTMPQINIGSTTEIYITDIVSPGNFYCQLADYGDSLDQMMNSIGDHYGNLSASASSISSPYVGQPCITVFNEDGMWYRAVVDSVTNSNVKVKFVDYGNTQMMKACELKQVDPLFMKLPVLAIQATLDQQKTTWTEEETEMFKSVTGEDKVSAEVTRRENNCYTVRIFLNGVCVTDRLLQTTEQDVDIPSQVNQVDIPIQDIQPNQTENVYVVFAESSNTICLQLSQYSNSLDEVMSKIESPSNQGFLTEDQVSVGMACCALFEGGWYRSIVKSKPSPGTIAVEYIDYGNTATLSLSDLRPIPESCVSLPRQAIHCSLDGAGLENVSKETIEETLLDMPLTATFVESIDNHWMVKLRQDGVDVCDILQINTEVISEISYREPEIACQSMAQVFVSHIESPGEFYVQLNSSTEELSQLASRLNQVYTGLDPTEYGLNADVGAICCAEFSDDNCWYRGIVSALPDPDHVQVHFVDYGNSDIVERSKVMVLKKEFVSPSFLAIPCSLQKPAVQWSEQDLQKFEALVFEKELKAEFVVKQNKLWQVRLTCDGKTILDLLKEDEPEQKQEEQHVITMTNKNITPGQVYECCLSHAESTRVFYLQFADDPCLDKVADIVSKVYPSVGPTEKCLTDCHVGSYCCAKFSEDDQWYRAIVTELCSDTQVKVTFVDYGNHEVVATSSLKKLEPELLGIPICGLPCSLANTKPEWSVADAQSVEAEMLDKIMVVTFVEPNKDGWDVKVEIEGKYLNSLPYLTPESQEEAMSFTQATLCVGKSEEVKFLMAESINSVWLQPLRSENELTIMMNTIADSKPSQPIPLSGISAGKPCLCKFSDDNEWYRAQVLECNGKQILVNYVDYGNSESVDINHISAISPSFVSLPAQAIRCSVVNIPDASADTIIAHLNEEYVELPLKAQVVEKDKDGVYRVQLFAGDGSEFLPILAEGNSSDSMTNKEPVPATEHQPLMDDKVVLENGTDKEECADHVGIQKEESSGPMEEISSNEKVSNSSDDDDISPSSEASKGDLKDLDAQCDFKANSSGEKVSNEYPCSPVCKEENHTRTKLASCPGIISSFVDKHKIHPGLEGATPEEIAYYSTQYAANNLLAINPGLESEEEVKESLVEKAISVEHQIDPDESKQQSRNDSLGGEMQLIEKVNGSRDDKLSGVQQKESHILLGVQEDEANSLPGAEEDEANSLSGAQEDEANSLSGVQEDEANSVSGVREDESNSLSGVQEDEAKSVSGVREDEAYSLSGVQEDEANSVSGVQEDEANSVSGVQEDEANSVSGVQ